MSKRIYNPNGQILSGDVPGTFPSVTVKDSSGKEIKLPITFVGAIDHQAAQQIYMAAKAACLDAQKDFFSHIAQIIALSLTPPQETEAEPAPAGPLPHDIPKE